MRRVGTIAAAALVVGFVPAAADRADASGRASDLVLRVPLACEAPAGPEYYQFPLVPTRRVPGTGNATGVGEVTFPHTPWGVALTEDGSYRYDFTVRFQRLNPPRTGAYVVWLTTTTLDEIVLSGELIDPAQYSGRVAWNKFLVVVTHEPAFDPEATSWTGPVVIRGMSRSGMMHTMAGHGPFQQENCAAYGYE
jgi:hypothetical protein